MHWDLASEHLKPKFARFGCLAPKSGRPDHFLFLFCFCNILMDWF